MSRRACASKRAVEDLVQEAAIDFEQFYEGRVVPHPDETGGIVVATVDCKGIPILRDEVARQVSVRRSNARRA